MGIEFHIFASDGHRRFTVKQTGLYGSREFTSLVEASRHLRNYSKDRHGMVVIHDEQGGSVNRIPLQMGVAQIVGQKSELNIVADGAM